MRLPSDTEAVESSGRYFHLFVHHDLPPALNAAGETGIAERVGEGEVAGTEYDIGGGERALALAGPGRVKGEVWRCPVELLAELDRDERVVDRLLRRVGVQVGEYPCWAYVVGPKLAPRLVPGRRLE